MSICRTMPMVISLISRAVVTLAVVTLAAAPLLAAELPAHVKFNENGSFQAGEAEFQIQAYSASWNPVMNGNWTRRQATLGKDGFELTAVMTVSNTPAEVRENIRPVGEDEFELNFSAEFPDRTQLNALHGVFFLPAQACVITVDGQPVALPGQHTTTGVYNKANARELSFSAGGGMNVTVYGEPLKIYVQDNRAFGTPTFAIRLAADPGSGALTGSSLSLKIKVTALQAMAVDLSGAANAGFADEAAYDGKGGWTDQGPDNDLRMIQPGVIPVDGVPFHILDPAANQGKGAIVLSGPARNFLGQTAQVELPENQMKAINLLHAGAWTPPGNTPVGTITALYADGSSEEIAVRNRIDYGNWWNPMRGANAAIGWSAENPEAMIGLYASSFPLKKAGPRALRFQIDTRDSMWMIAAVTLSAEALTFQAVKDEPVIMKENYQWKPLTYNRDSVKGTALDFSFIADAPAGKYGFIQPAANGTLTFAEAPDRRIRLFGPNLCFSANYLSKEAVDELAEYFVQCGYNTVRFHHHDTLLTDRQAADSVTLDPQQLDLLDYLFYKLKEKGIYLTTDLYTNRVFKPGDNIPECDFYEMRQMKMLIPLSRAAMASWKEFARRWMTHRNPYTGLTWAEDPALYCINLINEETLTNNWARTPSSIKLYETAFTAWLAENGLPESPAANNNPLFKRFLYELQEAVLEEQIRFVKEELGMKSLVTSLNYINDMPLTLLRRKFDVVDNHAYFDHPSFVEKQWNLPYRYRQVSAIARLAGVPRNMMATRIPGKPFLVTEFNYCNPNIYRAEGGPLIGAYAALQDWDALYRFAWSHNSDSIYRVTGAYGFDAANDPMAQLSDRISIAMFVRGDVATARETYAYSVPENYFESGLGNSFPAAFTHLGLITGIGSVVGGDSSNPKGIIEVTDADLKTPAALNNREIAALWQEVNDNKVAVSATGELKLDGNEKTFAVSSPLCESVTLPAGGLQAGALKVENADCFQTLAAISLDGIPIARSRSILMIHLTNISNTGVEFNNESKTIVYKTGAAPLLIRKGSAEVTLAAAGGFKVEALNCDGVVQGEITGTFSDGLFRFKADTVCYPGGVMAYHLTR